MNQTIGIFGEMLFDVFHDHSVLGGAPFNVASYLSLALDHFLHDKPCSVFLDLNLRDSWYTQATIELLLINAILQK